MKNKINNLSIITATNGFVVHDNSEPHMVGEMWAFESAESLAKFIKQWGNDIHKPIEPLPVLEKGKALIITGDEGVGKTTLARKIANTNSHSSLKYVIVTLQEITQSPFALGRVLGGEPDTVIIEDELNLIDSHLDFMKPLISNDEITVDRKGKKHELVKTPHFIICTGDKEPLKHGMNERRFTVLPL